MKRILFPMITIALLTFAASPGISAEENEGPAHKRGKQFGGPGGPAPFFGAGLSEEERSKMMAAREKALADEPSLKREAEEAWAKLRELQERLNAAMIKADPSVAPIIEKQTAGMRERFGRMGQGVGKGRPGASGGAAGAFSDDAKASAEPKKAEQ